MRTDERPAPNEADLIRSAELRIGSTAEAVTRLRS